LTAIFFVAKANWVQMRNDIVYNENCCLAAPFSMLISLEVFAKTLFFCRVI